MKRIRKDDWIINSFRESNNGFESESLIHFFLFLLPLNLNMVSLDKKMIKFLLKYLNGFKVLQLKSLKSDEVKCFIFLVFIF